MKQWLKSNLARRCPRLLSRVLRLKPNWNRDYFVFLRTLRRGDVVFDVGANYGLYTEAFADIVGRGGSVHAFEPVPPTFEQLAQRFADRARWGQVRLHRCAVADRAGTLEMFLPGSDSGQAALTHHRTAAWAESTEARYEVAATTLDAFAAEQGTSVDFIKIDIEGAELLALRGGDRLVATQQPALFIEVWERWIADFGYSADALAGFFERQGYDRFVTVSHRIEFIPNLRAAWRPALAAGCHNLLVFNSRRHPDRIASLERAI